MTILRSYEHLIKLGLPLGISTWVRGPAVQRLEARRVVLSGVWDQPPEEKAEVHHKKPARKYDNPEEANRFDNLVSLGAECYEKIHSARKL